MESQSDTVAIPLVTRRSTPTTIGCLPVEILEKIFVSLPVKLLVRFSLVSKSWNSIIYGPHFIKMQRNRSALLRRYTNVIWKYRPEKCLSAGNELLLFVEANAYLLNNPYTYKFKKIAGPLFPTNTGDFMHGLGYDSVHEDYKILKISKDRERLNQCELYSLSSNSWKKTEAHPSVDTSFAERPLTVMITHFQGRLEFVRNHFYWLSHHTLQTPLIILSFNVSSEHYGTLDLPVIEYSDSFFDENHVELAVLKGKLTLCVNELFENVFHIWMVDNYGEQSWRIMFNIQYNNTFSHMLEEEDDPAPELRPLYLDVYNNLVIRAKNDIGHLEVVLYRVGKGGVETITRIKSRRRQNNEENCNFEVVRCLETLTLLRCDGDN